ncbi:hypothetical protein B0H19DRAFT_946878, partial [Mycena capillaripes]
LIGSLLNFFLYGILAVQIIVLMSTRHNLSFDLVYVVFFFETISTAMNGAGVYYWFVTGFSDVEQLSQLRFSPFYLPLTGSIMALVVQLFFCYRIYILK